MVDKSIKRCIFVNKGEGKKMPFGERLRAARAIAGFSLQELADKIGNTVTKQAISKYERGDMKPESSSTLVAFSHALNVPVDFFFKDSVPHVTTWHFRRRSKASAKALKSLKETVRDMLDRHEDLEDLLGIKTAFRNPFKADGLKSPEDAELAARKLRREWGLGPDQPVASVTGLLESKGVRILLLQPGVNQTRFDGLSGCRGDVPFITLLDHATSDRIRFTLLHELAHVLLWPTEHEDARGDEKLCHMFASEFLLPAHVLRKEFPGTDRRTLAMQELLNVKARFGISMQAILYRAQGLGVLSRSGYVGIMRQFGSFGWRTSEPGDCPCNERPMRFEQLLFRAIAQDAISLSKAAAISGKSIDEIKAQLRGEPAISNH
jgi:Zn-dependent peptidase ImmA (M78 family)/transcriptional regulator with XRE-family HTH domain